MTVARSGWRPFAAFLIAALTLLSCATENPPAPPGAAAPKMFGPDGREGKLVVNWNPSALPDREWAPWLAYLLARVQYRDQNKIAAPYYGPQQAGFDEEVWARDAAGQIYIELKEKDHNLNIGYFNDLHRVRVEGFIREYVWIYLHRDSWSDPGGLRLSEFDQWRRANLAGHRAVTYGSISLERH